MTCLLHLAVAALVAASPGKPIHVELKMIEYTYVTAIACQKARISLEDNAALLGAVAQGVCERCR